MNEQKVTSADIKIALAKRYKDEFFQTEVKTGATGTGVRIFDAFSIKKSWANPCFSGFEIKVSRNDFLQDEKWQEYLPYCHRFSFVCPEGLIQKSELPEKVGLIYYNSEKKTLRIVKKELLRDIDINHDILLYILMTRLEPDRIPFYSNKVEYFKEWLNNDISNKEMGRKISNKAFEEIRNQAEEIDSLKRRLRHSEEEQESMGEKLKAIYSVLNKHGIKARNWYSTDWSELDKRLSGEAPSQAEKIISDIHDNCNELSVLLGNMNK